VALEPIRHDTSCRLCGSSRIAIVFQLNPTPPGDRFVSKENLRVSQDVYPLDLALCQRCGYVHLPYILNPEISYPDYIYVTKITLGLSNQYQKYADRILGLVQAVKGWLVVDLGSNDGTMLEAFKRRGMKVLGVEPARAIAKAANEAGIPTIVDFFTDDVAEGIVREQGKVSIVTANYTYANIDDVTSFTKNVAKILAPGGVFVVQTGYHPEQMKINMFDYIYHEHFSYFTVRVMGEFFAKCGLELFDVEKSPARGGSIWTVAQLVGGKRCISPSVNEMIREEEADGMEKSETYTRFAEEINRRKADVLRLVRKLQAEGKRIVGYGASHSTTTLTYHFELGEYLEYIVDDNHLKHGMYSPGYHLPVYPARKLYEDKPDYVIVLAWQYQNPIVGNNQQFLEQGGHFIVPLPDLKVI